MEIISNSFNEKTEKQLDGFILRKMFSREKIIVQGRITGCDKRFIKVRINREHERYVDLEAEYEIDFIINRLPYQVQHMSLDYFENHNLFTNFINNSLLDNPNPPNESMDKPNGSAQVEMYLMIRRYTKFD